MVEGGEGERDVTRHHAGASPGTLRRDDVIVVVLAEEGGQGFARQLVFFMGGWSGF